MSVNIQSIITTGNHGTIVDIECHLSNNLPTIVIVGFANKAVDEARERLRGAFASSGLMLPRKRITINLAPADVPKADSGFDLAIAAAILAASDQVSVAIDASHAFIGELGLDGTTRAVRGIIGKVMAGRAKAIKTFYVPVDNVAQAQLVPHVTIVPVKSLRELHDHLNQVFPLQSITTKSGRYKRAKQAGADYSQLDEVVGQDQAKRCLEIAAAGGHNVLFSGPPGTGKSMLAKALQSILPPLSHEEVLEVTQLHSLASDDYEQLVAERPFRAPHHSASQTAIVGGGLRLRPGEISLAHRGVLFMDELPEFNHATLEALRQPLEDHVISIARAHGTAEYAASFILVATANPCPCGYYGTAKRCRCTSYQVAHYQNKLSGPILDRIDLYSPVHVVHHDKLLTPKTDPKAQADVTARIERARSRQAQRYQTRSKLNATMTNRDIREHGKVSRAATKILNEAGASLELSARAYMRTLKVARTIADLAGSVSIREAHVSEALAYRYRPIVQGKS